MDGTEDYFIYENADENSPYTEFDFYEEEATERHFTKLSGDIVSDSTFKEFVSCFITFYIIIFVYLIIH